MNKQELQNHLNALNIPVKNNRIKKSDLKRAVARSEGREITASSIPLDIIKKVIDAVKNALKKGRDKPDLEKLNKFIKTKTSGDLMDFARSAIDYFKQGKLEWEDEFGLLQDEYQPGGFEIIPWTFLKRQFEYVSPNVEKRLPRAFMQQCEK